MQKELSPRQMEVVALVAHGLVDKEIAVRLDMEVDTVKKHLQTIRRHLKMSNRTQVAVWYVENYRHTCIGV